MLAPAPEKDPTASPAPQPPPVRRHRAASGLFDPKQLLTSLPEALRKLHPRVMVKNPVMFVVEVGSALTTLSALVSPSVFAWLISLWLWLTVVFANLAEAVAEGRGKAQAESLRKARTGTVARRLLRWRVGLERCPEERVPAEELLLYDFVVVEAGRPSRVTATWWKASRPVGVPPAEGWRSPPGCTSTADRSRRRRSRSST